MINDNDFVQKKLDYLAILRETFHECFKLYTCLSENVHRCELAQTEEQLENISSTICSEIENFKHIELW